MEKDFNTKWEKSIKTQGRDKVWNYFLDVIKTDKFQKDIEDSKNAILQSKDPNIVVLLSQTMTKRCKSIMISYKY